MIKLREEELVIAYHAPDAEHEVAQRRAHSLTLNFRMLSEHLAQQG
jgi:hypothetical protein